MLKLDHKPDIRWKRSNCIGLGIVSRKAIASGIYLNVRAVPHSALDTHAHRLVYGFQQ